MDNHARAICQCEGCGLQLNLFIYGIMQCQHCGAMMRPLHPMAIAYGVKDRVEYSQAAIDSEVERGLVMIYERLAAESELDRIDTLWYNKKERGSDGEENDGDRV